MRWWMLAAAVAAVAGCAPTPSQFLPGGGREPLLPPGGADPILVVFTHGTEGNLTVDGCEPAAGPRGGGRSVPRVLVDLAARDPDVHLWANCTYAVGDPGSSRAESNRLVPCEVERDRRAPGAPADRNALTKICKRAAELRALVRTFLERNPRLRPERVFLAGSSGGAWASLLALRAEPSLANAVIGFAPAFVRYAEAEAAGSPGRPAPPRDKEEDDETPPLDCSAYAAPADQALCRRLRERCDPLRRALTAFAVRCRQLDWLADPARGADPLPALLYAFRGDPHESPATLAPLAARPGVTLVTLPAPPRRADACGPPWEGRAGGNPHRCAHRDWFRAGEYGRIERFVRCRVADPQAACGG